MKEKPKTKNIRVDYETWLKIKLESAKTGMNMKKLVEKSFNTNNKYDKNN